MIFNFVVRKLRWLARVPLAPQVFDTILLAVTVLFDRGALRIREALEREACSTLGTELSVHRFGGVGFTLGRHELAHLHGNGLFDAFVGMEAREQVIRRGMALPHHIFPKSGWVSFWLRTEDDVATALELMRMAQRYRRGEATLLAA